MLCCRLFSSQAAAIAKPGQPDQASPAAGSHDAKGQAKAASPLAALSFAGQLSVQVAAPPAVAYSASPSQPGVADVKTSARKTLN